MTMDCTRVEARLASWAEGEVPDVIPAKARDPVTAGHAKPGQPASKLVSAAADFGIAGPGDRPVRPAAHHLNAGDVTGRPVQQVRHRQRVIHHQAIHLDHLSQTLADAAVQPHEPPTRVVPGRRRTTTTLNRSVGERCG